MRSYNMLYVAGITLVATLGGLLFGYDTAVISGAVSSLEYYFVAPRGLPETTANILQGFTVSSSLVGCVIGAAVAGYLSMKFGRRRSLIMAALLFLLSAIGSALPETGLGTPGEMRETALPFFIFYRILGGIGVGVSSMLSPMYIAEVAPYQIRGRLVSWNQFAIIFGMVVVYFVNYGIGSQGNDIWLKEWGWRWMFASEVIPAALFFGLLFVVPESPRWLMMNNRSDKAYEVLQKINPARNIQPVMDEIRASLQTTSGHILTFGSKVLVIGVLLSVFQQFVGINVVLYYAPEIFKNMEATTDAALLKTIFMGSVNLTFTVVAIMTVDNFGRKPLMMIGAFVMSTGMFGIGFSFFFNYFGTGALMFMLLYIAGFAISWGPVVWVLLSEIFPNRIRGKAMSLAVAAQWIANFTVSQTFPMMDKSSFLVEHFNHGFAFWVYGLISLIAALFVWRMIPETKGKSLEDIERYWVGEQKKTADARAEN